LSSSGFPARNPISKRLNRVILFGFESVFILLLKQAIMKISITSIVFVLVFSFMISCKKTNDNSKTIQVTEYKSNLPLQGAVVYFDKWVLNFISGGYIYLPIDSETTDQSGSVKIAESVFNQTAQIRISKGNYHPYSYSENPLHTSEFSIDPIGHLKLHLVDTSVLPVNVFILLSVSSERSGTNSNSLFKTQVRIDPIPVDTTLNMDDFGGQKNRVLLTFNQDVGLPVLLPGSWVNFVDVSRDGITELEIKY
jgi:hypothetical protein